tara:strand:- start:150 stop:404 length:255 start_codon:yes stop_codon:yes gene_type:complete
MTEFKELVEETRLRLQVEEWSKGIKYIHANNGVIETKYNNGDVHYEEVKEGGKSWTVHKNLPRETLLQRFLRSFPNSTPRRKGE